ncbi:hypothetical protein [Pseudoalteromonas peptidolytica]|uniref:Lipoprotein SmpA/OmlA domain-containing protein n=1 Tax=Pseudoalteromonas peptidolytica F12-50-A1 TaxID=1315280 RepID=A0A8I0MZN6_9GAMM|nr:hypothetical protein [Pseudoalteromonas peptidolytica]MBE0348253.1 hypothetical protein [Pseudoalteromonas peptidolytica F12-50-A1]NLR16541.1 hypothetical protein [Pseudoalteromonas peptidolytica]GEK08907.1 hypothetical protein PPE03_11560 [Pseudoalteromonas peptidolytica]
MMKKLFALVILGSALSGCAQSSYSVGSDFSSQQVSNIENGKTTTEQLILWFGNPYSKAVISASQVKWMYLYNAGTVKAQSYVFSADIKQEGTQKVLDILVENGVVVNHTYSEGPTQGANASIL